MAAVVALAAYRRADGEPVTLTLSPSGAVNWLRACGAARARGALTASHFPAENASVTRVTSWLWRPELLRMLISHARLAGRLLREPRVPFLTKAVPLLAALYLVSPLDLVPDVLPLLGQMDDLSLVLVALAVFLRLCPAPAVAFQRAAIAAGRRYAPMSPTDDVIDAEWRRD